LYKEEEFLRLPEELDPIAITVYLTPGAKYPGFPVTGFSEGSHCSSRQPFMNCFALMQ